MSNLAIDISNEAGWPARTLERMCSLISRGTAPVYVENSEVLAIGQRCVTSLGFDPAFARSHSSRAMDNVLKPEIGDVLLNSTGTGTIGRSCVFDSPKNFIVDGHVTLLRSAPNQFRGEWLDAVLRSSWGQNHLERFCYAGSTNQVELSRTELAGTSLPVPSIDEQNAFVRILNTLDAAIRKTELIVRKLKQVKQGLLHDLLTRGVDANGELRLGYEAAPQLYQASSLGWIPKEWNVKQLQEVGEAVTGTTPPAIDPHAWGSGIPFITPSEIVDDRPVANSERQVSARGLKYIRMLPAKTVVVVCIGSTIGKVGITATMSCTNQQINAVLPYAGLHPEYLFLAIRMHIGQLRGLAGLQAVPIVNKTSFESIFVPVAPLAEQIEIAKRLDNAGSRINEEEALLHKLRLQKSGLMDDLLTGRVRVTPLLAQ